MLSYKHSPFDEDLCYAMEIYNEDKSSSERFTLVDARIASLVHSYSYSNKTFFASNDYLSKKCFTTPATVQKSINRLCSHNILNKNVSCTNGKKQRFLSYNEPGAEDFKNTYI